MEITISVEEYERLVRNSNFLGCLEACGVDNWSGYGEAQTMFFEEEEE